MIFSCVCLWWLWQYSISKRKKKKNVEKSRKWIFTFSMVFYNVKKYTSIDIQYTRFNIVLLAKPRRERSKSERKLFEFVIYSGHEKKK